jgi:dipeptidyl aminopeptidase/acylaminoacyl peptidase
VKRSSIGIAIVIGAIICGLVLFLFVFPGVAGCTGMAPVAKEGPVDPVASNPLSIEALRKRTFQVQELVTVENLGDMGLYTSRIVSYQVDGLTLRALLNIPKNSKPKQGFPVVVVNHGHITPAQYSTTGSYVYISRFFAENGFIMIKPDYRGHGKSEGETETRLGRPPYAVDVLALMAAIPAIQEADSGNVFLWGHSMGGEVSLAVMEAGNSVRAASLWGSVSASFPESFIYFRSRHDPALAQGLVDELKSTISEENFYRLSPSDNLSYVKAPILLQHGTKDESVPYEWSVSFEKKLSAAGIPHKFLTWEGQNHNLSGVQYQALVKDAEFFRENMKPAGAILF